MKNFIFALRYLSKIRGSSVMRIVSLTPGLGIGLIICAYVNYLLTFDRFFPDRERIYQVWTYAPEFVSSSMFAPMAAALAEELPPIESATRLKGGFNYEVYSGEKAYDIEFLAVDTCFFRVLDYGLVKGDMSTFTGTDKVMLSETLAATIFGDRDPMNEVILLKNQTPLTVTGIFRDPPRNNHLGSFNAVCPFDLITGSYYTGWDGGDSFPTYVKLRPGKTAADVEALMPAFCERHIPNWLNQWKASYKLEPITRATKIASTIVQTCYILTALALLLLFVSAMNYVLISVSTLVSRSKTFAMLRCSGAWRSDIRSIFLWETALLLGASLAAVLFLIWGLQRQIEQLTDIPLADLFSLPNLWGPATVACAAFLLSGLLPGQIFASVPLSTAFRISGDNRRRWKQTLLTVQFGCVTFALTLLTAFSMQLGRLRNGDMGFNPENIISVMPLGTRSQIRNIEEALEALPEVESAGATYALPVWGYSGQPCFDENTREMLFGCRIAWNDENYLPTIGMEIAAGRNFTMQSGPLEVLVNETYVRMRGWTAEEAIGKRICYAGEQDPEEFGTIIGVVRDFRTDIGSGKVDPIVLQNFAYVMDDNDNRMYGGFHICIRLHEASAEAIDAVRKKIQEYESVDNCRIRVLSDLINERLSTEIRIYRIAGIVSAAVLIITFLGLGGYLRDEICRRRREIAIRKVNGASRQDIILMMGRSTLLLVLPATVAGALCGYGVMTRILQLFVTRIDLRWQLFTGICAAVIAAVCAILVLFIRHAAAENPAESIKTE